MVRLSLVPLALVVAWSCGTQSDADIPPELLAAIADRNVGNNYPTGPTGGNVGDIATDICFPAWENPSEQGYSEAALTERCLHHYYDPEGGAHRLLFVVSSAIWCQACQVEFGGTGTIPPIGESVAARYARGLRALGGLFQNARGEPASEADAIRWAKAFDVDFPFGVDSAFSLGRFAKADAQPLHMLVDTRTMRIIHKATGGNIELLWSKVDEVLDGE
jgi:hypothetical protein